MPRPTGVFHYADLRFAQEVDEWIWPDPFLIDQVTIGMKTRMANQRQRHN